MLLMTYSPLFVCRVVCCVSGSGLLEHDDGLLPNLPHVVDDILSAVCLQSCLLCLGFRTLLVLDHINITVLTGARQLILHSTNADFGRHFENTTVRCKFLL